MDLPEKRPWFVSPISPLPAGKGPSSLFCFPSAPGPGAWKPPGCHAEGTPHGCVAPVGGCGSKAETNPQACFLQATSPWQGAKPYLSSCWRDSLLFIYDLEFRSEMLSQEWVSTYSFQISLKYLISRLQAIGLIRWIDLANRPACPIERSPQKAGISRERNECVCSPKD